MEKKSSETGEQTLTGREIWLFRAAELITKEGIDAFSLDGLIRNNNLDTKEFYDIFHDWDNFKKEILNFYHTYMHRKYVKYLSEKQGDPRERFWEFINNLFQDKMMVFEMAVRIWSRKDDDVCKFLGRIDKQRIKIAQGIFEEMGFSEDEAYARIRLHYYSVVGEMSSNFDMVMTHKKKKILKISHDILTNPINE